MTRGPRGATRDLGASAGPGGGGPVVDRGDVVVEVSAAFARYEEALRRNDLAVLTELFWDSVRVRRFGLADHQLGAAELHRWRAAQPPLPEGRRLIGTDIVAFGEDTAVVTTFFGYGSEPATGRQSQTWVRFPEGWRIVSAHVSAVAGPDVPGSSGQAHPS